MMETLNTQENAINTGEGTISSPPPSSSKVSSDSVSKTGDPGQTVQTGSEAAEVQLTREGEGSLDLDKKQNEELTQQQLTETLDRLNDRLNKLDREIELKTDQRINKNYVSVVDKQSKEVIREFPPEEIRSFIARFMEFNEKLASTTDLRSLIINLEV